ncbi:MAG: hypothetical protein ABSH32_00540 [Bryobacteraceae bacterium]
MRVALDTNRLTDLFHGDAPLAALLVRGVVLGGNFVAAAGLLNETT